MAEKDLVLKEKVEHAGVFDFPALYILAHTLFKEDGYGVNEDKYSEKVSGNKRDIEIEWKAMKDISDYFKEEYKLKFEIKELTEVEVEIDGQKKKMNKGKLSIEIVGALIRDKDNKWETTSFNRFARDVYNKYVIPSRVEDRRDHVRTVTHMFLEEIKKFLDLSGKR
jgi:hypothetical protein